MAIITLSLLQVFLMLMISFGTVLENVSPMKLFEMKRLINTFTTAAAATLFAIALLAAGQVIRAFVFRY
jgi:Mn2+/Fe2+ NRAMP family transporter